MDVKFSRMSLKGGENFRETATNRTKTLKLSLETWGVRICAVSWFVSWSSDGALDRTTYIRVA
jgi:hypothetical protein